MDTAARAYHFDGFRVDLVQQRLVGPDGAVRALSSRAYDALIYLVENRSRVVSKDDLLKAVWPRVIVEENNLNQAISVLRRALGESRDKPRCILTIPGRGYRFVAEVAADLDRAGERGKTDPAPAQAEPLPSSPGRTRRWVLTGIGAVAAATGAGALWWSRRSPPRSGMPTSIAVLPFQPLIATGRNEALELGMAETLINRLSGLPGMVVAPLSSVRRYTDPEQDPLAAGRELKVSAVLDGHVQVQGDQIRLTARLLDVASGTAIWAGRFDERLSNFFAMQDSLAQQIVEAMVIKLPDEARQRLKRRDTENVAAWQLYLNGRYQWDRKSDAGFRRAIEFYEAALKLDPNFALPAAGLADIWTTLGVFGLVPPKVAFARARAAVQRAIVLDERLAEAQAALGHIFVQGDRDWTGGERQYRLALELKPAYAQALMWLANNHVFQGRIQEGLSEARQAQALEPMSATFAANVGMIQYFARDYGAAYDQLAGLVEASPQASLPRHHLVRVHLARGEPRRALELLDGPPGPAPGSLSDLGCALALDGQVDAAKLEIARIEALGRQGFGVGYDLALIWTALGEHEQALAALERGLGDSSQMIGFLNSEPGLDPIRDEPRFRAVSRQLGLG